MAGIIAGINAGQEKPSREGWVQNLFHYEAGRLSDFSYVSGLGAFLALDDLEFNLIAFSQAFVSLGSNGAVVYEHISSIITADKAVSLGVVKPLHSTFQSVHLQSSSVRAGARAAAINQPG
jgi:hypothetical protein